MCRTEGNANCRLFFICYFIFLCFDWGLNFAGVSKMGNKVVKMQQKSKLIYKELKRSTQCSL